MCCCIGTRLRPNANAPYRTHLKTHLPGRTALAPRMWRSFLFCLVVSLFLRHPGPLSLCRFPASLSFALSFLGLCAPFARTSRSPVLLLCPSAPLPLSLPGVRECMHGCRAFVLGLLRFVCADRFRAAQGAWTVMRVCVCVCVCTGPGGCTFC
jgi:hypothetical protein